MTGWVQRKGGRGEGEGCSVQREERGRNQGWTPSQRGTRAALSRSGVCVSCALPKHSCKHHPHVIHDKNKPARERAPAPTRKHAHAHARVRAHTHRS